MTKKVCLKRQECYNKEYFSQAETQGCHNTESCHQAQGCLNKEASNQEQGCRNKEACNQEQGFFNTESNNLAQGCHDKEAYNQEQRCNNTEACNETQECQKFRNNQADICDGQLTSYGSLRTFILEDDLVK